MAKKSVKRKKIETFYLILNFVIVPILVLTIFAFLISQYPKYESGFENINELIYDSQSKDEFAQPEDYIDYKRPSWKTYQNKIQKSLISQEIDNVLAMLRLKRRPEWHASYFEHLLEKTISRREAEGFKNEFVIRLTPKPGSKFIIWGDLSGAYHSVIRGLQKLIELNVIDENLKLKSSNDFIVFTGDANSRSPFIMEMLTLIMKLDERNTDKIFYLTGNNEKYGSWRSFGLLEELQIKGKYLETPIEEISQQLDRYFNTLPMGIYISSYPHRSKDFVRISHFAMECFTHQGYQDLINLLDDSYFSDQLLNDREKKDLKIINLDFPRGNPSEKLVNVKAIIKSLYKLNIGQNHDGLQLLIPDKAATAWTILSCPTAIASKVLNFYNDTFVILETAEELDDWTITLYYRDIRGTEDFKTKKYNFISGQQLE